MAVQHLNNFIDYISHEKKLSKHTSLSYQTDLLQFQAFVEKELKDTNLLNINYLIVRSWVVELLDTGISERSVNRKLSSLKSFYKYLLKNNLIKVNPLQKITGPKTPKKLPVFVDETNMYQLFNEIKFEEGFIGIRDKLLLDILYQTGLRRAELISLNEQSIDLYNLTLKVLGKRNKERIIPISLDLKRCSHKSRQSSMI